MTTIAMFLGLIVAHVFQPGTGLNINPASLDSRAVSKYADAPHQDVVGFLLNIIPGTVFDAFTKGEILQVLLSRCCSAWACRACRASTARRSCMCWTRPAPPCSASSH